MPSVLASPLAFFFGRRLTKKAKDRQLGEHHPQAAGQSAGQQPAGQQPAGQGGPEPVSSQTRRDVSHRVRN
jgi:hypothetical protein